MPAENAVTELWIYAGKHISKGRLRDHWVDPEGRDLLYPSLKANVIGGIYEVRVDRGAETLSVYGTPSWTGERMTDHQKMTEYIVKDTSQRTQHTQLRREKNAGDDNPLDDALQPLLRYARACKTRQDKDALIATVIRRMTDAW